MNADVTRDLFAVADLLVRVRLKHSAHLQLYDSDFRTGGVLTIKAAFAHKAVVPSVIQAVTVYDCQFFAGCGWKVL